MEFVRRRLGLLLRVLISGGILAVVFLKIDWGDLAARVRLADPAWLAGALLLIGATMVVAALRWRLLLRVQEIDPGFSRLFQVSMIGQFFNSFLLGTTGGDVVKIFYIAQAAPGKKSAAGLSVLLDRLIGLVALILLGVALTACQYSLLSQSPLAHQWLWTFYLIALGVGAGGVALFLLPRLMKGAGFRAWEIRLPFHERIEQMARAIREAVGRHARDGRANLGALLLSFVAQGFLIVAQWLVARALHLDVPFLALAAVSAVIYVLIAVPVSVSGLGVRESLFILFLGLPGLGVSAAGAVAVSLIGFGLGLFWNLVGGIVYLRYRKDAPAAAAPPVCP